MSTSQFPSSFKPIKDQNTSFPSSFKPIQNEEPVTLKGSAGSYGSGVAGGAGGLVGDVAQLAEPLKNVIPSINPLLNLAKVSGIQNTPELTETTANVLGVKQPQNSLERILQQSGEFGGQEGVIGTGFGGPVGGALGLAHGSISGALYGGLKELGVPDTVALGISAVATLSPIAARRLIEEYVTKSQAKKALAPKNKPEISQAKPPEPISGIRAGTELPETHSPYESRAALIKKIEATPDERRLGDVITKESFHSDAQAGREQAAEVQKLENEEKKAVSKKYKEANEVTRSHNDIYPELAAENEKLIEELEGIKRNTGEEAVYQDALAIRKLVGTPDGLIEQNAYKLLKQADSFSKAVKYEAPYQGYKGRIKGIVKSINNAVINSLKKSGKNADAVIEADKAYGTFADRFYGDEIEPFLYKNNKNPESLYRKSVEDPGTYRALKGAIGSRKHPILNKVDRDVVLKRMDKYVQDPSLVGSEQYVKDLSNTAELIGKEKIGNVDEFLRDRAKKFGEPSKMTPEDLDKIFKSRRDIRKFKKELQNKGLQKEFQELADEKVIELFKEGQIGKKTLTGNEIVKVLEKNQDVLTELLTEDVFKATYKDAKISGENELGKALRDDLLKKGAKIGVKGAASGIVGKLISLLII